MRSSMDNLCQLTCIYDHPDGAQVDNYGLFPDEYGCGIWRGNLQTGGSRLRRGERLSSSWPTGMVQLLWTCLWVQDA